MPDRGEIRAPHVDLSRTAQALKALADDEATQSARAALKCCKKATRAFADG